MERKERGKEGKNEGQEIRRSGSKGEREEATTIREVKSLAGREQQRQNLLVPSQCCFWGTCRKKCLTSSVRTTAATIFFLPSIMLIRAFHAQFHLILPAVDRMFVSLSKSYVNILTHHVLVLGSGAFGPMMGGVLINGISTLIQETLESSMAPLHVRTQQEDSHL